MIFTVAIDGPAAAGKGTISRAVSDHFGFAYLDTGLLYRAVGLRVLAGQDPIEAARALDPIGLDPADLRTQHVAEAASQVAVIAEVRQALVQAQQHFARRDGGAVLDGRDIGTAICPEAEAKLFVTASAEKRAARRLAELQQKGAVTDIATVLAQVQARDARDAGRGAAPMRAATDATIIDTTDMTIDMAVKAAIAEVAAKLENIQSAKR